VWSEPRNPGPWTKKTGLIGVVRCENERADRGLTWAYEITKYPQSATFLRHAHARPRVPVLPTGTGKTRTAADVVRRGVATRASLTMARAPHRAD